MVSSLLLTIPVDSLIASSTWRRLYGRYLRLNEQKHHHPSGTTTSSSNPTKDRQDSSQQLVGESGNDERERESDAAKKDPNESFCSSRPYPSEDTLTLRSSLMSHNLSACTAEYGQLGTATIADKPVPSNSFEAPSVVDTLVNEQKKAMVACSPPAVTLSHLNALMNDSDVPNMLRRTLTNTSGSSSSTGNVAAGAMDATDRQSFTSTNSAATGGASSTTGSGVAGHRMLSKEEMQSILRANSFDSKSSRTKKNQHVEENPFDSEMEAGLNNSWLSNASLSYDSGREIRGLRSVSQAPGMHRQQHQQGLARLQGRLIPLTLWVLCTASCIAVDHWMYIAASVGTLSTTMLLFIFPTMFYFRMTLASDYSATPLFARIVPNALYMGLIQAAGIAILLCDIVAIIYLPMSGKHIIESQT